jgi:large subunit ribosomal protein L24
MSKWIRKGDKVLVISGNSKGETGKVLTRSEESVVIQGVNLRKKHAKRRTQEQKSQILEFEAPIHISNVSLCNDDNKPIRAKVRVNKKGEKELFYLAPDKKEVFLRPVKTTK